MKRSVLGLGFVMLAGVGWLGGASQAAEPPLMSMPARFEAGAKEEKLCDMLTEMAMACYDQGESSDCDTMKDAVKEAGRSQHMDAKVTELVATLCEVGCKARKARASRYDVRAGVQRACRQAAG